MATDRGDDGGATRGGGEGGLGAKGGGQWWAENNGSVGEQVTNKESAYKYAWYFKTNKAQQYSKGKQVTFDLPSDMKERMSLDVH